MRASYRLATAVAAFSMVAWINVQTTGAEPQADFTLTDENLQSARYGDDVVPSQYRQQVSAWYFGSAT